MGVTSSTKARPYKRKKGTPPFTHLHVHTENSLLDGKGLIKDVNGVTGYVSRAQQLGMKRLAIMDHGVLCGAPEFYRECRTNDIEPLLAEEFYFTPDFSLYKGLKSADASKLRYHVGIMARDADGFRVLAELSTATHGQYHFKPMLDRKLIAAIPKEDRKKLVVLSGCAGSIISQLILEGKMTEAEEEMRWWAKKFPHFYVELMHHKTDFDKRLNRGLVKLARKLGLKWVITNDPHFVMEDEACHHDVILAISTGSDLDDPNRFRFEGEGYWLKSPDEMRKSFKSYGEDIWLPGMKTTNEVADLCKIRIPAWENFSWHIPKFPKVDDSDAELRRLAEKGLKKCRLLGIESGEHKMKEYREQMEHELAQFAAIPKMADFLLVTEDVIRWARKKMGMRVGPGRGSICGSLVAFLIGIHKVDPIYYDLLFERFLNPERPKMPDVDTDYPKSRRAEVLEYYPATYGAENTMPVAAFGTMQAKATFKRIAGTHGMDHREQNRWAKKIMEDEEGNMVWPAEVMQMFPDMIDQINALHGLKTNLSSHPAGMVIFDPEDSVRQYCPEMWIPPRQGKPGRFVMQYNLAAVDSIGLLKQDNLALRTLDTIEECVQLVKKRRGITVEPDDWWPGHEKDDDKVFKMLAKGDTSGVFQMEGGANTRGIQDIKPREFEDLVTCTSVYRAGPIMAGAPGRLLKNRKDKKVRTFHKSMKKILQKSWGEMIYDEQMFQILFECAGFSWSRVDDAKTAMKKKKVELMDAIADDAIKGFRKTAGMDDETATKVWKMIAAQASYLFNRSHAVAYSITSYQTARLKYLYPLEYFAALLRTVEPKSDADKAKRERYMKEAVRMGFTIEPPDINISDEGFMPDGHDRLLFGLSDMKGWGKASSEKLAAYKDELERKRKKAKKKGKKVKKRKRLFNSVDEVYEVVRNKGTIEALAACGAFRSLGIEPDIKKQEELLRWQFEDRMIQTRKRVEKKFKPPTSGRSAVVLYGEIVKAVQGTTKKGTPYMTWTIQWKPGEEYRITLWSDVDEFWNLQTGSIVRIKGKWNPQFRNVSVGDGEQIHVLKGVYEDKTAA